MSKLKKPGRHKLKSNPALGRSDDLCKQLVAMAAFNLQDNEHAQQVIYKAVRQLQLLDAAAVKAGILPAADEQSENDREDTRMNQPQRGGDKR